MAKGQNYRTGVDPKIALELLNVAPRAAKDGELPEPLGVRLQNAVKHLESVIEEANEFLESSELAPKLAEALAVEKNKRGFPSISVDSTGKVMLDVDYSGKKAKGKKRRKYKRGLPLLAELRKEAAELGVDVSHLGQKRRAVFDFLEEVKARRAGSKSDDDGDPPPMSAGTDETTVEPAKNAPKPPKRRKVKLKIPGSTPEAQAKPKSDEESVQASPNLTAILETAPEDVDIDELLSDSSGS